MICVHSSMASSCRAWSSWRPVEPAEERACGVWAGGGWAGHFWHSLLPVLSTPGQVLVLIMAQGDPGSVF